MNDLYSTPHLPPLKPQRERLKVTQEQLAVALGVSRLTYIKWENHQDTMPIGRYYRVHQIFQGLKVGTDTDGEDKP